MPGTTVDFLLYTCNLFICEIIEVGLFGNILSDEFVCIFNRSLLPRGIRICEIDDRTQILCNELVCGKFRTIVSGYGLDVFL